MIFSCLYNRIIACFSKFRAFQAKRKIRKLFKRYSKCFFFERGCVEYDIIKLAKNVDCCSTAQYLLGALQRSTVSHRDWDFEDSGMCVRVVMALLTSPLSKARFPASLVTKIIDTLAGKGFAGFGIDYSAKDLQRSEYDLKVAPVHLAHAHTIAAYGERVDYLYMIWMVRHGCFVDFMSEQEKEPFRAHLKTIGECQDLDANRKRRVDTLWGMVMV